MRLEVADPDLGVQPGKHILRFPVGRFGPQIFVGKTDRHAVVESVLEAGEDLPRENGVGFRAINDRLVAGNIRSRIEDDIIGVEVRERYAGPGAHEWLQTDLRRNLEDDVGEQRYLADAGV